MRRLSILALAATAALLLAPTMSAAARSPKTTGPREVVADAEWLLSAQLPDGAIAHHADRLQVWPYLANFSAMGLARAREVTGDARYSDAAWRWLEWYQAHQDANGYVTDYLVAADGSVVSKGDMDSTDAYAGTFLMAARKTWKATSDRARLKALGPGIAGAVKAIESTQDTDGLTWAKPSWRVKYLMDQAETYAGLLGAAEMAAALTDSALQQRATASAARLKAGVERLWNPSTGAYDWAVHDTGARQATDWSVFYPDAQQQTWAVAFGLTTGERANALMSRFASVHPTWDQPLSLETFGTGLGTVGYWPVTGWAFAQVGDLARSQAAAASIRSSVLSTQGAWPYTTGNAGQLIQLQTTDPGYLAGR